MSSPRTVFLLVCGGWHPPAAYDKLKAELEARGYEYHCPLLPSLGRDASGVTYQADVEEIRKVAVPLFEQGKEVALIAHSAGGVPAVVVSQGFEVEQRATTGKIGGFSCIVFVAAVIVPLRGSDTLQTLGGSWHPSQGSVEPYTKNNLMSLAKGAEKVLYNDIPDSEAEKYYDLLQPHSQDAFETPVQYIASDVTIPMTYIITEQDLVFPASAQKALAATVPGLAITSVESSHSPFASQPAVLSEMLIEICQSSPRRLQ